MCASARIKPPETAEIGIFGGTGNYDPNIFEDAKWIKIYTPYGPPSDLVLVGWVKGRKVAFIPRHGRNHTIPPFKVNYRANVWAMKSLGVKRIISPAAVGSLQPEFIKPYQFVVCDQFFDRTSNRRSMSFYEGGVTGHVPFADPVCPELRRLVLDTAREVLPDVVVHPTPEEEEKKTSFTYVCIEGPRFSTRAESLFYKKMGFSVVGMTAISEAYLAREAEICFINISLVTDTDVYGLMPVTAERVARSMRENVKNVNKLIYELIPRIPEERSCSCGTVLDYSLY
ncbi:MAG TPA: S-methyl-5'-thioadenosine phosphorylase [Candidatus Bathyarchaeota archaeon]|nr:S-methyl-5'-thioadenosine phosphorylase [Candidatus Bathyarchaeota archaeon]